jgi:hypothetical protein
MTINMRLYCLLASGMHTQVYQPEIKKMKYNTTGNNMKSAEAGQISKSRNANEAAYSAANAFVHKNQNELKKMYGGNPKMPKEAMHTDSYMCNNEEYADKFAKKLTHAMDKVAVPVR